MIRRKNAWCVSLGQGMGEHRWPRVALEHKERHSCCKVTKSMPWSPQAEANCLASVQIIRAEAKQPFPLRYLLWLCCPGGSDMSKDVYNVQWLCSPGGVPSFSACRLSPHLHSEHMPTSTLSFLFASAASWKVTPPCTAEYSVWWWWSLLPDIHILSNK
jgi:hypothetical protein